MADQPPPDLPVLWRHVPTYFVDGVLGSARAGGLHRIVFGEICFNPELEASHPAMRPVINLVINDLALETLIAALQEMQTAMHGGSASNDD